ncbi:tryptophan 2,3-dioxygenase [Hamadaea flava]|uniref:Tryptophan 2,3-dioxygenase family protein n=1 Tax=Hamadaea flava TaxID=1742688 RepID=A0ABV8LNE1_9ACTN|nr:tryptophan 2,3-dioxygenase family protein [Hamadaea flava]MCP2322942.1 tryptophan 2,3-dioxygenase [Hamadaea flava]
MKKHTSPELPGEGDTDYARYMRLDTLLSLQRHPDDMVHRDELLFQVVHQSSELWLKLAVAEIDEAAVLVGKDDLPGAELLLGRASLAIRLVTDQLDMFRYLKPADFEAMKPALGNGSGAESPGWRDAQKASRRLGLAFQAHLREREIDPATLYPGVATDSAYRLAEAMIEWDEQVALWRVRHYTIAIRIGGHGMIGTPNSPADWLAKLIDYRFFPELWQLRVLGGHAGA